MSNISCKGSVLAVIIFYETSIQMKKLVKMFLLYLMFRHVNSLQFPGIQCAESGHPDLILLDIMMPGMNGFETCRQLKASAKTKAIPVIFMRALSETTNKVKGFACGAVDYITKPIQAEPVSLSQPLQVS